MYAPFRTFTLYSVKFFSNRSITGFRLFCKRFFGNFLMIFFLLILADRCPDLRQDFLGNRAYGIAQVVENGGSGKLRNALKVLIVQVVHGVQAAAGQKGILDAGGHKPAETHLQIQIVQFFQQAVPGVIGEVPQPLTVHLIHSMDGHIHQLVTNVPARIGAIPFSQGGEDGLVVFLPHLPQVRLTRPPHRAGVRIVENIFQAGPAPPVLADQGDALGAGFHPAAHGPVPQFHAGAGSGVRALGVDQKLLIKRVFE